MTLQHRENGFGCYHRT